MFAKFIGAIAISVALAGCGAADLFPGNSPLSEEALSELAVQKASITPFFGPFPDAIDVERLEGDELPAIQTADLEMVFLLLAEEIESELEGDYVYAFSKQNEADGEYELLINRKTSFDGEQERYFQPLYRTALSNGIENIPDVADRYLGDSPVVFPIEATHVELRFLPKSNTDYRLEVRLPLDSFFAWRKYIKPLTEMM